MRRAPTATVWNSQAEGAANVWARGTSSPRLWFTAPAGRPSEAFRLNHGEFEVGVLGGVRRECLELRLCSNSGSTANVQLVAQLNLEFDGLPDAERGAEPLAGYERELDLSRAIARTRLQLGRGEQTRTAFWSLQDDVLVLRVHNPPATSLACTVELNSPLPHRATAEAGGLLSMLCDVSTPSRDAPSRDASSRDASSRDAPSRDAPSRDASSRDAPSRDAPSRDADRGPSVVVALQAVAEEGQVIVGVRQLRVERASTVTLILSIRQVREETRLATLHRAQVDLHALSDHGYEGLRSRHALAYEQEYARSFLRLWPERSKVPFDERRRQYRIEHEPGLLSLLSDFGRHWLVCNAARLAHTDGDGPVRRHARPAPYGQGGSPLRREQACRDRDGASSSAAALPRKPIEIRDNPTALRGKLWSLCWAHRAAEVGQLPEASAECVSEMRRMTALLLERVDAFAPLAPFRDVGEAHDTALGLASLCRSLWDHVAFSGDTHGLEQTHALVARGTRTLLTLLDPAGQHMSPLLTLLDPAAQHMSPSPEAHSPGLLLYAHCQQLCARALQLGSPLDSRDHEWRGLLELSLNRLDCWLSDRSIWRSTGIPAALTATRASTLSAALAPAVAWLQAQRNTGVRRRLGEAHACVLANDGDGALASLADLVYPAPDADDPYGVRVTDALFTPAPPVAEDTLLGLPFVLAEMILQSHDRHLHLLPALPESWHTGQLQGLRAHGGFEVAMAWEQGRVLHATIRSLRGQRCRIRSRTPLRLGAGSVRQARPVQSAAGVQLEIDTYPGTSFTLVPADDSRDTLR